MGQYRIRLVETLSRNILIDADSEEDASQKAYALSEEEIQKQLVRAYDMQVVYISLAPFNDWPFEKMGTS